MPTSVRTAVLTPAKVFDLMLGEIEKSLNPGANEAQSSVCTVM